MGLCLCLRLGLGLGLKLVLKLVLTLVLALLAIRSVALRLPPTSHVVTNEATATISNCFRVRAKLFQDIRQGTPLRFGLCQCDLVTLGHLA